MEAITIPVGQPLTFDQLKALNPTADPMELASAFAQLPTELRGQAWEAFGLRVALDAWGEPPEPGWGNE